MGFIKFFLLFPSKAKFLQSFVFNEQLKAQADQVWRQLDALSPVLLLLATICGSALAVWYYKGFNESPGRHYKIKYWGLWFCITLVVSFVGTLFLEYIFIKTNIKSGIAPFFWLLAFNNALYSAIAYFITSFVMCNYFTTNAYKFLNISLKS